MKKLLIILMSLIFLMVITRIFVFSIYKIPGKVMYPLVHSGQKVLVLNKWWFTTKSRDVVIIRNPADNRSYIRRIIACGGDSIAIRKNDIYVNGELLYEPYKFMGTDYNRFEFPEQISLKIPHGEFFVMGDNRETESDLDSRIDGTVHKQQIVGKLIYVLK